jgi:hypothetical protein
MKSVILHIGMPKSASTFLQKQVFPNLEDVLFCTYRNPIFDAIRKLEFKHRHMVDLDQIKIELDQYLETVKEKHVLISNEMIFGNPWHNFMNHSDMAYFLKILFPEAKILTVLRKQDDFLSSAYLQAIRIGFPQKKKHFFNLTDGEFGDYNYNGGMNIDAKSVDLYHFIKAYEDHFGKENIKLLPFELFKKDKKQFLEIIYSEYGLTPYFPENYKSVNKGYTSLTLPMSRFFRKFIKHNQSSGYGFFRERPFRGYLLKNYEKSKILGFFLIISNKLTVDNFLSFFNLFYKKRAKIFSDEERKKIMGFYQKSNKQLSDHYQLDLDNWGYFKNLDEE